MPKSHDLHVHVYKNSTMECVCHTDYTSKCYKVRISVLHAHLHKNYYMEHTLAHMQLEIAINF